ncbi:MAG TPA: dethiobiotin synthase [Thermodesulfobacteriota bacterium]|nr:dethiobiotin synthase [Deltaproteobacteria bacterium]HNR13124.1 dethiobiotin synthase [Thermodesulfobacteriota bacterium]HNU70759.1 dethiobiotin synthase [Thermodesulfobacteriota bacterium]HOC37797.1 dethiobiotin synthase [Thermodesulfobacteriota bacterium]
MTTQRRRGIFVTGTDTGVGKSVVAGAIAAILAEEGINVGVMKPAETGCLREDGTVVAGDAEYLRALVHVSDPLTEIVPYCFREPLAPGVAARCEGVSVDTDRVARIFDDLSGRHEFMVVEGAGGLLVPFSDSLLIADLVRLLDLPLLVVARGNLGTINHTLMTVRCAEAAGIPVCGIVINNVVDDTSRATRTNPDVIAALTKVPIWGVLPFCPTIVPDPRCREEIVGLVRNYIDLTTLRSMIGR